VGKSSTQQEIRRKSLRLKENWGSLRKQANRRWGEVLLETLVAHRAVEG